jgi:hypothetical protein
VQLITRKAQCSLLWIGVILAISEVNLNGPVYGHPTLQAADDPPGERGFGEHR